MIGGGIYGFLEAWKRSLAVQIFMDRLMLKLPVFGDLVRKSTIARWTRTLSTMFAAGVPLVEALDSVGGAVGQLRLLGGHQADPAEVSTGTALTVAMHEHQRVPEHGAADGARSARSPARSTRMLGKVADFFEHEVDDAVEALSSPDGADDHGGPRHADRRHGDRHVPADLQAGPGGLAHVRRSAGSLSRPRFPG